MIVKPRLAFKLSLFILAVLVLAFSLFIYYSVSNIHQSMMDVYLDKALAISYAIDSGVGSKEVLNDNSIMLAQIQKMMWLQEDILSISINLPQNEKLVTSMSNDYSLVNKTAESANLEAYNSGLSSSVFFHDKNRNAMMLKVISPIHISGKIGGTFEIVFTLENIESVIQKAIWDYLLIAVFLSVVVIFLIFLLIRFFILSPVDKINTGVKSISGGGSKL